MNMFAPHRDFLYKRSHPALAARATPAQQQDASPAANAAQSTSDPKTTSPVDPLTSVAAATQVTNTPTQSSSPNNPSSPTQQSSSASSSSSQPSSSSSSRSSSTSASSAASTRAASSSLSTSSSSALANSFVPPGLSTQVVGASLTPSSTLAPATTSSAGSGSSGATNTGAIVGGIAGTLAGIAILGFLLMWCMRRQRDQDIDDFDAQAFKRQSAMLVDEPVEPSRSYNPCPPTMIERHNTSPALAPQPGYGGQNFYGYDQQSPFGPAGSPPPQAFGAPPMAFTGYNDPHQRIASPPHAVHAPYNGQQPLARQPSSATYLGRQPSAAAGYAPPITSAGPPDLNAQYIDLNRSSVSPYQAAQYADISRQLGATDPNAHVTRQSLALPEGPLPSPFDDPVQATPTASAPQTRGNAEPHQRPVTIYEEGDAYGAI